LGDDAVVRACRERGLVPTSIEAAVLSAVLAMPTHPTAAEVYARVRRRRRIARASAYRALETLVGHGLVGKACHPGAAARYDGRRERHHHLVCLRCERIEDLHDAALDAVVVPDVTALGFHVTDVQVHLRGLCGPCRRKRPKEGPP
jgi:Fur family peroxide stress response transcriptional regulator